MTKFKLQEGISSPVSIKIINETKENIGFTPNMYLKMGHNASLLDSYTYAYNSFRNNSGFSLTEQEVVFLSVSFVNECEYCMSAHSFVADATSEVPTEITNAIRNGQPIGDKKLAILSKVTKSLTKNRGHLSSSELVEFLKAGFTESHVLAIITAIAVKTMSNYSNHNTHPEVDEVFAVRVWKM